MPGKIIEIESKIAHVDFDGNVIKAQSGLVDVSIGDYVLVHAGCILQKLSKEEGDSLAELFKELEDEK